MRKFQHIQATPNRTWTVYHALGVIPTCDVLIDDNGKKTKSYSETITHPDVNTTVITWTEPRTGVVALFAGL